MGVRGRRTERGIAVVCGLLLSAPSLARAQGTVSGRIAIAEKPGETAKDLDNTVIYLAPKSGAARTAEMKARMAISGRQFSPRVRIVTIGSSIEYPNQDPFSHNVFSTAAGAAFDLGVYGSGTSKSAQFRKPGAFPVYCNIHEKMTAYVVVVNTPHFTQAAADGRWSIAKVPAGRYELHAWHERTAEVVKEIDVPAAGLADVDQKLDATGYKQLAHKDKFGKDYAAGGVRY
jgi:plastocyanin